MLEADEKLVSRDRTKKANTYSITNADGADDVFKAFGRGIPEAVIKHLNMSDVNMHLQLDGPFLLNKSAPDVARYFNNIVNLDVIDRTISNIAKILRAEKGRLAVAESKKELAESKLQEYDWLGVAEDELIKIEKLEKKRQGSNAAWSELCTALNDYGELQDESQRLDKIIQHSKLVDSSIKKRKEVDDLLLNQCQPLLKLIDKIEALSETKANLDKIAKVDIFSLISDKAKVQEKIISKTELKLMISKAKRFEEELTGFKELQVELEEEFSSAVPDVCPIFDVQCEHIDNKEK